MRMLGMVAGVVVLMGLQPGARADSPQAEGRTEVEKFIGAHQDIISEKVFKVGTVSAKDYSGGTKFMYAFFLGKDTRKDAPLEISSSIVSCVGTEGDQKVYAIRFYRAPSRIGRRDQSYARKAGVREAPDMVSDPSNRTLPAGVNYLDLDESERVLNAITTVQAMVEENKTEKGETSVFSYRTRGGVLFRFAQEGKNKLAVVDIGTRQEPRPVLLTSKGLQKVADLIREATLQLKAKGAPTTATLPAAEGKRVSAATLP